MIQAIAKAALSSTPLRLLLGHASRALGSRSPGIGLDTLQKGSSHRLPCAPGPAACLPAPGDESGTATATPNKMWKPFYDRGVAALKKNDAAAARWLEEAARLNPGSVDVQEALAGAAFQTHAKLVAQGDQWARQGQRQLACQAYAAARAV